MASRSIAARLSALLLFLALHVPAMATPPGRDRALEDFLRHPEGGMGAMLKTPRDRVVFLLTGAGYARVIARAHRSVEPETLRAEMERALNGAGLRTGPITAEAREGLTTAWADERRPRPFARSGTRTLRYGAIVSAFRKEGRPLHAATVIQRHVHTNLSAPALAPEASVTWRDVHAARPKAVATLRTRLSPVSWALGLWLAASPFALAAAILAGIGAFRRRDAHPVERAARVTAALYGVVLSGALAFAALIVLQRNGALPAISDLWLGRPFPEPVRNAAVAVCGAAALGWMVLSLLRGRLVILAAMEPWRGVPAPTGLLNSRISGDVGRILEAGRQTQVAVDAEERALRARLEQWRSLIKLSILALAFATTHLMGDDGPGWVGALQWPLAFLGVLLVDLAFKRRLAPYEVHTPDRDLTRDAQALGLRLGVVVREAEVDDTWAGRTEMKASFRTGRLRVSRRVLREMTPAERDFILLRTMAGARPPRRLRLDDVVWPASAAAVLVIMAIVYGPDLEPRTRWLLGGLTAALAAGAVLAFRAWQRSLAWAYARVVSLVTDAAAVAGAEAKWAAATERKEPPNAAEESEPQPAEAAATITLDSALRGAEKKGGMGLGTHFKRR